MGSPIIGEFRPVICPECGCTCNATRVAPNQLCILRHPNAGAPRDSSVAGHDHLELPNCFASGSFMYEPTRPQDLGLEPAKQAELIRSRRRRHGKA